MPENCQHNDVPAGHCHRCVTEIVSLGIMRFGRLIEFKRKYFMTNFPEELFILVTWSPDLYRCQGQALYTYINAPVEL